MSDIQKEILILVDLGAATDIEKTDTVTTQLMQDLRNLDASSLRKVRSEEGLKGTKSGEMPLIGQILLGVAGGTVPALIEFLTGWLSRRKRDTVTIKLVHGENELELTYNPEQMSDTDLEAKVKKFQDLLGS